MKGLRRDLTQPFSAPPAKIPLTVRPLRESDVPSLLDVHLPGLNGQGIYDRMNRVEFVAAGIPTGYVAVTSDGRPCYMQFLIGPEENAGIQAHFQGLFPLLGPDEALLEHAFTLESFQGMGIMPSAMARIAEMAQGFGARWVVTFVAQGNIAALKGCQRAGFSPHLMRHERWFLFRRHVTFEKLPLGTPYPFEIGDLVTR